MTTLDPSEWVGNNLNYTKKSWLAFCPLCSFFEETFPGNTSTLERRLGSRRWRKIQWRLTRKTAPFFVFLCVLSRWRRGARQGRHQCAQWFNCAVVRQMEGVSRELSFIQNSCFSSPRWDSTNLQRRAQGSNTEWLFIRGGLAHWNKEVNLDPWVF